MKRVSRWEFRQLSFHRYVTGMALAPFKNTHTLTNGTLDDLPIAHSYISTLGPIVVRIPVLLVPLDWDLADYWFP